MSSQLVDSDITVVWDDYINAGRPQGSYFEDVLARHYLPYATQVGERFHRRVGDAVERDEIVQSGYLGLLEAIRTFDPEKASFQTYANRKIQWKIADGLRGGDWLPRRRRDNVKLVQQAVVTLQQQHNTSPDDTDIANLTGLSVEEVRVAYEDFVASKVHSLNDLVGGDSSSGEEQVNRVIDRNANQIDDSVMLGAFNSQMFDAIRLLPLREKQMLALYYYGNHTLEEIGFVFGVGYSRVSQILKRAVLVLRTNMEKD